MKAILTVPQCDICLRLIPCLLKSSWQMGIIKVVEKNKIKIAVPKVADDGGGGGGGDGQ